MGPGTVSLASHLEPAAIHLDHRKGRSRAHSWGERLGLETAEMIITISLELLADLVGNPADLALADGHLGQFCPCLSRLPERGFPGSATDDLAEYRRAVVMGCEAQARTVREKNPGGKPCSGTWVQRSGPRRPRSR